MLKTLGKVFIDGVQLTNDPEITRNWPSRQSTFPGLEGASTVQDFGRFAKDKILTLDSKDNYINASVKAALDGLAATRGGVNAYTDFTGLEATVKIMAYDAQPTFIRDGGLVLYRFTMTLKIMGITKMDGVAYTGS